MGGAQDWYAAGRYTETGAAALICDVDGYEIELLDLIGFRSLPP